MSLSCCFCSRQHAAAAYWESKRTLAVQTGKYCHGCLQSQSVCFKEHIYYELEARLTAGHPFIRCSHQDLSVTEVTRHWDLRRAQKCQAVTGMTMWWLSSYVYLLTARPRLVISHRESLWPTRENDGSDDVTLPCGLSRFKATAVNGSSVRSV